jgi:hypothetical protein
VLNETSNTTMTFINTFNALSVPKLKEFLQYILDLRTEFSRERQGVKYIPIHDPNYKHPDYEIHPRQRIWFDVPVLRSPAWQSVQVLPKSFDKYLEEALVFMRENANTDNFAGFYDFEIDKVERNLALMQERDSLDHEKLTVDRKNFYSYFSQYDARKNLNFEKAFPEMSKFYQGCKKL